MKWTCCGHHIDRSQDFNLDQESHVKKAVNVAMFNLFKSKDSIDYKARFERKMCVAKETPEPIFDLSECNLKNVPTAVFSLCKVLRKEALFLQENQLINFSSGNFQDLTLLKVLDLHSNKITKLEDELCNLTNLEVLNLNDNLLTTLPETMGRLKNLTTLNMSFNKLKKIPLSILQCLNLQNLNLRGNPQLSRLPSELAPLQNLLTFQFDGTLEISSGGKIQSFLDSERGSAPTDIEAQKSVKEDVNYFLIQEKLKMIEQQKESQRKERLAWEKTLAEDNQKEFEIQQEGKANRKKLIDDIKIMETGLENELLKIQEQKDAERNQLIRQCLEVEEKLNSKVGSILENARKFQERISLLTDKERAIEEQLLYHTQSEAKNIEKSKIVDTMNQLVKEELLKAEKFHQYEIRKKEDALHWINEESELTARLADLAEHAKEENQNLTQALQADEELQKAAVASLMEQSDTRSWNLAQQVQAVEEQLAELTKAELARKKLEQEDKIVELSVSRVALTELLLDLFAQQQARRSELVAALRRMEGVQLQEPSEGFWLQQYQRLLESTSRQLVQKLELIDLQLHQQLLAHGVVHYLPLLVEHVTCGKAIPYLEDYDLIKIGVDDADDRFLLLKAFKNYLSGCNIEPSAPPVSIEEPSAPLQSPVGTTHNFVTRAEEECVVCLAANVDVIFFPCGHMCCCSSCADLSVCPLCRSNIEKVLRTWTKL